VSVERLIAAPAARIFDVLADPTQHPVIDGSGMVREARAERPSRLSPGATFGMSMRMGVAYAMRWPRRWSGSTGTSRPGLEGPAGPRSGLAYSWSSRRDDREAEGARLLSE
jgi:uncharacterized protein YndB with AHSA1/START domain